MTMASLQKKLQDFLKENVNIQAVRIVYLEGGDDEQNS